jgi:hypothetical protein
MRNFLKPAAVMALGFGSASAFAVGPDLSTLSGAVDFGTVVTAILAVGVAAVSAILAWRGVKMVYSAIKGA